MNPIVERMQRAQQYLNRAEHLKATGQPVLCATYARRAGQLIEEARTLVAEHRGSPYVTALAMERAAQQVLDIVKAAWADIREIAWPAVEATQNNYALAGPSKGGPS